MGVKDLLGVSAIVCSLSGCTYEGSIQEYLADIFPEGSVIQVTDSCSSAFGLGGGAAVFEIAVSDDEPVLEPGEFSPERGAWTREQSMQEFALKYGSEVGISATVLDGKNCLMSMRDDAVVLLGKLQPGLYFRSHDQSVVIMMPDDMPGMGVLFSQGH